MSKKRKVVMGRYAGGKGRLFRQIINLMPPHETYIEGFLGGGSVLLNKKPAPTNIGIELDAKVIEAWVNHFTPDGNSARTGDGAAPSVLALLPSGVRDYVLYRDNAQYWLIENNTLALLPLLASNCGAKTLIYLDPPYLFETRRQQCPLYEFEFTDADHEQLLSLVQGLRCKVMLSGYWSEMYAETLRGWHVERFEAFDRGNNRREEVLWMNFAPPNQLHDYGWLGDDYRERWRIRKKRERWICKLQAMPRLERLALFSALEETGLL